MIVFKPLLKVTSFLPAAILACGIFAAGPIQAQSKDGGEQRRIEQLRRLQSQNQALQAEVATLKTQAAKFDTDLKAVESKAKAATDRSSRESKDLQQSKSRLSEADKKILALEATSKANNEELTLQVKTLEQRNQQQAEMGENQRKQIAQLQADLKANSDLAKVLETTRGFQVTQISTCSMHNRKLVGLVDEVSERYRTKSCADSRSVIEPLMGLRRAEFDQLAEDYRAKAGDERFVAEPPKR